MRNKLPKTIYTKFNIHELDGKHVRIYFNLHRKTWSIKDKRTGLVIGYSDYVSLIDCKLIVSQKGRERVILEKRKNVHAYVDGIMGHIDRPFQRHQWTCFTYNPYKYTSFINKETLKPLREVNEVIMHVTLKKPYQIFKGNIA